MQESNRVDDLVERAIILGDPLIIFNDVRKSGEMFLLKGFGMAKALYESWTRWADFTSQGVDDDWENVAPAHSGLSLDQCRKYRDLYRDVYANDSVPDWVKPKLAKKPIQGQLKITVAAREGQISEGDWEDLTNAVTNQEIRSIVRRIRGQQTSSENALIVVLDRDGIIKGKIGDNGMYVNVMAVIRTKPMSEYEEAVRYRTLKRIKSVGIVEL